ncbi:MAG: AAA family ATPase [Candidatus Dormiibacterota bacterium]
MLETHVSVLTFQRDTVSKRKKPVRFDFVDFREPRARLAACREELRLNRRLAPDVYLRVDEMRDARGRLMDAAVVMRRLPDRRQLRSLIDHHADVGRELTRVARVLAAFHSEARRGPAVSRAGLPAALRRRWRQDLDEWSIVAGQVLEVGNLDRERALAERFLEAHAPLLRRRAAEGHIVDGHGDLRADSIYCLQDGPRIIDCLEFDKRLRYGDELADVGFLAMDLESMHRPDLAAHFVAEYQRFAGAHWPPSLLHFYIAQRAMVRSKVECLRAMDGITAAIPLARAHLEQCRAHLEAARPVVVVTGGGPRTGKSTIARAVAAERGWIVVQSDEVRRDVTGPAPAARAEGAELDRGRYSRSMSALTYRVLFSRARELLSDGYSVILDATFPSARTRLRAGRVARACHADLVEIECQAARNVVRDRAALPRREGDLSEATPDVAEALRSRRDPWPSAYQLDTTGDSADAVARCLRVIDATPVGDRSDRATTVRQGETR